MKKMSLLVFGVVVALAVLPLVGNKYVQNQIKERVSTLKSFGLGVQKHTSDIGYLSSQQHYEFLLKDSNQFLKYLSQYSKKQIPHYVKATLDGVLIGMDVEYSNIPFAKEVSVDIYPLALSPKISQKIQENDINFNTYLDKFLESKGILYHINYNIISQNFDGFLKDIDEKYTLKDGTQLNLQLQKSLYKGNGDLIAPKSLSSTIKLINIKIKNAKTSLLFKLKNLSSSYNFDSQSTYISGGSLKSLKIQLDNDNDNLLLNAKKLQLNYSSNDQGEKAQLNTRASMKSLSIKSNQLNLKTENFVYDIAVNDIDKKALNTLKLLVSKAKLNPSQQLNKQIIDTSVKLLSKGLNIKIVQWYMKDIVLNDTQKLGGFDIKMNLNILEDTDLASKMQLSPLLVAQDIDMTLNVKISKIIYKKLTKNQAMTAMMSSYLKEDEENFIFDISFEKGALKLNGKPLK